jgi:hypothetical protein
VPEGGDRRVGIEPRTPSILHDCFILLPRMPHWLVPE